MTHTGYNPSLVALSIVIAVLAWYTALDLGGRVRGTTGLRRLGWIAAASLAMGGGVWSMHFVGMLAFETGAPVFYGVRSTLASFAIAVGATGAAFAWVTRRGARPRDVVLVVDDDPAQRDLMTRFLAREGFGAVTAADGQAGIQLARSLRPRAILLDVTMPGLDGWSVLSALKADPAVADVPVVMVTFVDERGLAATLGAADYIMKPVHRDRFRQVMDRYRGGDGRALVVDDDGDARARIRTMLERDGWGVVEAADGRQALERVAQAVPRVVLLDLDMPVMDGFAFLQAFRALPGCDGVPVVVLTAKDLTREDRRRLQGADEVLGKGVTSLADVSRELAKVVRAAEEFA